MAALSTGYFSEMAKKKLLIWFAIRVNFTLTAGPLVVHPRVFFAISRRMQKCLEAKIFSSTNVRNVFNNHHNLDATLPVNQECYKASKTSNPLI